jgi:two-component system, NarL family, nitrate/nitrite response regulator NarL
MVPAHLHSVGAPSSHLASIPSYGPCNRLLPSSQSPRRANPPASGYCHVRDEPSGQLLVQYLVIGQRGQRSVELWGTMSSKEPMQPVVPGTIPRITTLLICRNTILHAGLRHILSDTQFALTDNVFEPTADVSAFAGSEPVLILLFESLSLNEYLEALERLKAQCPSAWVVVLADHLEPNAVVRLYEAGLSGLCSPAMVGSALVKALELVVAGEAFLPAAVGLALLEQQSRRSRPDAQAVRTTPAAGLAGWLSDREVRILRYLMQGASNKEIAHWLGLAEATVKVHIKSILRKVQAANRTQAAMWAQKHL